MINTEPCPSYYLPGVSLSITAGQTSSLPTLPEPCLALRDMRSLLKVPSRFATGQQIIIRKGDQAAGRRSE
jgi:hypothetical protein